MPIPFAQTEPLEGQIEDTSGVQPASSVRGTYGQRAVDTLENGTFIGDIYRGVGEAVTAHDGSDLLSKQDAEAQYGNEGLTHFDGPVTKDYAKFKASQDAIKSYASDSIARGGSASASNTWLGFGLSTATGLLDPVGDGAAILTDGITKLTPLQALLGKGTIATDIAGASRPATNALIGGIPSRVASGLAKATIFTGLTEPLHAALDDHWSPEEALQRLGSAALFMGITDAIAGKTPLRFYEEEKNIPSPQQQETWSLLEDHLQDETKAGMAQASVARAMNGESFDPINDLVGLDSRIIEHEAKIGKTLSFEDRAEVLESMDNGSYVDPNASTVTVYRGEGLNRKDGAIDEDHTGRWFTTNKDLAIEAAQVRGGHEGGSKVYSLDIPQSTYEAGKQEAASYGEEGWDGETLVPKELAANKKAIMESYTEFEDEDKTRGRTKMRDIADQNKVTLPNTKGLGGFINLEPVVKALTASRIQTLTDKVTLDQTTKPPNIETPALTEPNKRVTTLLQPYEHPIERAQETVPTGSPSGVVGGTRTSNPQTKTEQSSNKWGGLPTIRAGGASSIIAGSRIRFRNTKTYEHGALTFIRGAAKPFVVARADKGTFTPSSTKGFHTFNEAHNWLKENEFNEARIREPLKEGSPLEPKVTLPKETEARTSMQNKEKGFEVMEHEAPHVPSEVLRQGEEAQIARQKAINGLRKYGLQLWSKDGGWWPDGVEVVSTGQTYEYGKPEFDKIYGKARDLVEGFIHKFRKFHDEVMISDLAHGDKTNVSWMPHQLPKPLDKSEGYRLFTLHNRNAGAEPSVSWSHDPSLEAHAHLTVLRDKEGKPYLAVHEAQAGYSGNLKPEEGIKMLADRMREYANEQGMPLVLPSSKTAAAIYGRGEVNGTFSRAYSKGGYVRKGFAKALDSDRPSPVELEKLWNPMGEANLNYEGLVMPDDTSFAPESAKEIDKDEDEKQPGYNQAVNCVTRS